MMNLEQYVVRKITTWTDAGKLQRIKLLYANNVPDEIVNLPQLEGGKINELDLHPGNKTIKNVYGDLASGQGLLDGIAVTLSGGDTL
jgi:hypothetical protein